MTAWYNPSEVTFTVYACPGKCVFIEKFEESVFSTLHNASSLGVVVLQVEGDPEFDDWSEPKVLATHGEVPERD